MNIDEIITECINNNDRAKTLLFNHKYNDIRKSVSRYFFDYDTISELTQLAFIKIFNKLVVYTYQTNKLFDGWCHRLTQNLCLDYIRTDKQKFQYRSDFTDNDFIKASKDIEQEIIDQQIKTEQHIVLNKYINKLPENYIKTIQMHYFENKTFKTISEELNCSESGIKSTAMRARRVLEKKIKHKIFIY